MKKHKYITCASFGGTGSSAITDLLKEFDNILSLGEYEFTIAHEVDGISDLQHYLVDDWHRLKVDEGIYRFRKLSKRINKDYNKFFDGKFSKYTEEYIDRLIMLTWDGYWHQQRYRLSRIREFFEYRLPLRIKREIIKVKIKNSNYELVPYQKRQVFNYVDRNIDFFNISKMYTTKLLSAVDKDNKYEYLAFDQLIPPFNVKRYLNYFDNLKVIIVDRDPRDLYILNKKFGKEGWRPTDDVEVFITWFKNMRSRVEEEVSNNNVLLVKFEDLIYKYDDEVEKIIKFLEVDCIDHINKKLYFNPEISIKNTKMWEKFDDFNDDVTRIKKELGEFCYNI